MRHGRANERKAMTNWVTAWPWDTWHLDVTTVSRSQFMEMGKPLAFSASPCAKNSPSRRQPTSRRPETAASDLRCPLLDEEFDDLVLDGSCPLARSD